MKVSHKTWLILESNVKAEPLYPNFNEVWEWKKNGYTVRALYFNGGQTQGGIFQAYGNYEGTLFADSEGNVYAPYYHGYNEQLRWFTVSPIRWDIVKEFTYNGIEFATIITHDPIDACPWDSEGNLDYSSSTINE